MIASIGRYAVCLLFGGLAGFGLQWQIQSGSAAKTALTTEKAKSEKKDEQAAVSDKVVTQYVDRVKTVYKEGERIIEYVPVYLTNSDNLMLPGGFRVLHDAAVSGTISESASGTDAAPVQLDAAARTVVQNYTICRENAERLTALQEWAREQRKLAK